MSPSFESRHGEGFVNLLHGSGQAGGKHLRTLITLHEIVMAEAAAGNMDISSNVSVDRRLLSSASLSMGRQESHSARMQQVGDRVVLEELLKELGVAFISIKPKGRFRHVDLEELKILDSSSSFNELAPSSAVASIQRKGENVNASGHCSISLQDLSLGPVLAVGSAGRIYYGIHGSQEVAVKVFKQTSSINGHPSFQQEVSFLSQLDHPNIVKFLGAYDQPPLQLHITEYLPQGSLRDFLERIPSDEPVRYPERLRMARDIACGLEYLHSLGILHRDCKSENMVIAADGTVKLTDFGIARMEGEPEHMTSETGTYRYMAPEVIGHRPYNRSADVYSFGLVLWEILSGQLPFAGLNAVQAAFAVVNKHQRPVIPPGCPVAVRNLIQSCWHPIPSKRPAFSHVLASLDNAIQELEAPSSASPSRAKKAGCWNLLFRKHAK